LRVLLMASAALLPAAPSGAAPIGRVTAANEAMLGTPPAASRRPLALGLEVVSDERIETTPLGAGQIVFRDRTALTVWPNSDVVLDRYVYDPERGTGQMAIGLSRGLLRFVGGAVSKENDVTVTTPHAVVAVRGGIALIEVTATSTRAVHVAGRYTEINGLRLSRTSAAGEATQQGSAQYLGVLDAGAIADVFGRPPGQGTGGLPVRPDPGAVEARAQASGLTAQGSGAPGAPTAPRLSTTGEMAQAAQSPAEAADVAGVTVVRQAAAATAREQAGAVTDPTAQGQVVTPPGVALPPSRRPSGGVPIPGVVGAQFTTTGFAATQNVAVSSNNATPFRVFLRAETTPGTFRVYAEGPDAVEGPNDAWFNLAETPGFSMSASTFNGNSAIRTSVVDPGLFYLATFRTLSGTPTRSLNFFGTPTPTGLWQTPSGPDITVRLYDISDELFTGIDAPFSTALPVPDFDGPGMFLIPEPNSAGLEPAFLDSSAKLLAAGFSLAGSGLDQSSSLAVYTTRATINDIGAPVAATATEMRLSLRLDSLDRGVTGTASYGILDDGAGNTAFGPNGEYLLFGQGGRAIATGPNAQPQRAFRNRLVGEGGGVPIDLSYGDTRLASLDSTFTLPLASRTPLGAPPGQTDFAFPKAANFTGGFAVTHAASAVHEIYLLATDRAPDVRFGFQPSNNGVVADIENLRAVGNLPGQGVDGLDLVFGNTGSRSALLDDSNFAIRETVNPSSQLTGMRTTADNRVLAPDNVTNPADPFQNGFDGGLVTAALVGTGDLLLPNADPAYLRWGWWAGTVAYDASEGLPDERLHLGSWVAGVRARDADLADAFAANRSATYAGFGIAHVVESTPAGRAAYVEPAVFGLTYDFGQRAGTAAIVGVMGQNFGGPVTAAAALPGNHYGGTLTGTRDGGGTIDGAFFQGGGDPVAATAGRFAVSGTTAAGNPAQAVGIVAGQQ
jgi:hypothetical protein